MKERQLHALCSWKNSSCWRSRPISHQPQMGSNLIHNCETGFNVSELFIVDIFFNSFFEVRSEVPEVPGRMALSLQLLFFSTLVANSLHTGGSVMLLLLAASPNDEV